MYISGGFNVYPAEVEQALARIDGVVDVAVVGVPDERLGEVGKAYVVVATGSTDVPTADDVIAFCKERLANFKVPRDVEFVDALPRNLSGKVLKTELRRRLMDLDLSESELAFRAEAREWLAANVPAEPLPSMDTAEGFAAHREWEARLAEARWSVVSWPEEYGGREASLVEWVIFEEEYYRAGAPGRVSQNGIFLLAPIIFDHGTQEQQDRFLPTMATGEQIWAQAWSEPEAGSDLASLRSTARRDDDRGGWVLNGQKTWSSRATYAHWGFGLFRSDPEAAAARRADLLPVPARRRRRHRPADRPARRRGGLRRDLLRGRLRARRRRARRARRRLAGGDEHRRQRARPVAALPRPVLRRRRPAGRALPGAWFRAGAAATTDSSRG